MPRTAPAATTVCVIPEVRRSDGSVDILLPERNMTTLHATELSPALTAFSERVKDGQLASAALQAVYYALGGHIPREHLRSVHDWVAQQPLRNSAAVFCDGETIVYFYTIPREFHQFWAELNKSFDPKCEAAGATLGPRERRPSRLHWAKLLVDGDDVFTPSTRPQHRCTPSPDACAAGCRRSVCAFASGRASGASLVPTPSVMRALRHRRSCLLLAQPQRYPQRHLRVTFGEVEVRDYQPENHNLWHPQSQQQSQEQEQQQQQQQQPQQHHHHQQQQ